MKRTASPAVPKKSTYRGDEVARRRAERAAKPAESSAAPLKRAKPGNPGPIPKAVTSAHEEEGPFYTLSGAAQWMHLDATEVVKRAKHDDLIMVTTSDGDRLLPAWQFNGRQVDPRILEVLEIFRAAKLDHWAVVAWATAPDPQFGGASAIQALHDGVDPSPVLDDARHYAWRWSQ